VQKSCKGKARSFRHSESGGMTAFSLFILSATILVGGYAIDVGNVMMSRTQLQVAADASGHAALLTRELNSEADAIAAAHDIAMRNMPVAAFGNVLHDADITFGNYDHDTKVFTPSPGSRNAVEVTTRRTLATDNAIPTYLLRIVGLDDWNISTTSVFTTYIPSCLREGFVSESVVDLQSNNSYSNGFCVHSNSYVSLNSNNYFEPGTIVSMPDENDIELPNSGFTSNDGLQDALRSGSWNIRIIDRIASIINALDAFDSLYLPEYITSYTKKILPSRNVTQSDLIPGKVHTFSCTGGADLTIKANVIVENVVIVTTCSIKFEQGVVVKNAVIATRSNSSRSITAASGLQIGENDNCAAGGGAQLVTMGSMNFPADLRIYGGQLLAYNNVSFAANANGIQGAAIVAGGEISGTSNMAMGFCGSGMENNFQAEYFKLVY
jgi:Flp pilus assembly protein TadG